MEVVSLLLCLFVPVAVHCQLVFPVDCGDIHNHDNSRPSGVYTIYPIGATSAVQVYCDMSTDGGKWTLFQRRMDGSVNFYRPWEQYKRGFGSADGEYWLGLENLFHLTLRRKYELRVDMEDFEGNRASAEYASFSVDPETYGYSLYISGFTDGGAGESLMYSDGMKFSTFDRDQDSSGDNCAKNYLGAFWYSNCYVANPNGLYHHGAYDIHTATGVVWNTWKGEQYSLKSFSMKIRPVVSRDELEDDITGE